MLAIFFLCYFALLINKDYISYNETFLLCIFFILFFIFIIKFLKVNVKQYTFMKILKNFFLNLVVLRLSYYLNKLLILTNVLKENMTKKYKNKITLLKKKSMIIINDLVIDYTILLHYIYLIYINKYMCSKKGFIYHIFLIFSKKIKKYDKVFY